MSVASLFAAAMLATPAPALDAAPPAPDPLAAPEADDLRRAGGFLSILGFSGVALGTGFMIADSDSDSPFGPKEDQEITPRGPIAIGIGATFLVVGLSLALPPAVDGLDLRVAPAGPGLVVLGRF